MLYEDAALLGLTRPVEVAKTTQHSDVISEAVFPSGLIRKEANGNAQQHGRGEREAPLGPHHG